MKVVICGPRDYFDYDTVCKAIDASGFEITEVVSGGATGVDSLGERWSKERLRKDAKVFDAEWDDITVKGAVVAVNKWGRKYNKMAGFMRNEEMAEYCDAVIAIDTGSPGTGHMIKMAKEHGCELFKYNPDDYMEDDEYGYRF